MKHLNICCNIPICLKIVHISFIKISAEKLTAYYIQICLSLMGIVLEAVTINIIINLNHFQIFRKDLKGRCVHCILTVEIKYHFVCQQKYNMKDRS